MKILYQAHKFGERRSEPTLDDREVITIETVGKPLGLVQDKQIFQYFRSY